MREPRVPRTPPCGESGANDAKGGEGCGERAPPNGFAVGGPYPLGQDPPCGTGASVSSEVGIDIIETARIRNVLEKHPRRFLDRVYTEWEQMYCRTNILHLSGRWAAKEAVSKVLGLGVRGVGWREIEIRRTRAGQPTVTLHGRAEARREAIGLKSPLSVSISHIRDLAVAVAVGLR